MLRRIQKCVCTCSVCLSVCNGKKKQNRLISTAELRGSTVTSFSFWVSAGNFRLFRSRDHFSRIRTSCLTHMVCQSLHVQFEEHLSYGCRGQSQTCHCRDWGVCVGFFGGQSGTRTSVHSSISGFSFRHHFINIFHFHITEGVYVLLAFDSVVKYYYYFFISDTHFERK
jgi:hypothetical protein